MPTARELLQWGAFQTARVVMRIGTQQFGPAGSCVPVTPGDAGELVSRGLAFPYAEQPKQGQHNPTKGELVSLAEAAGMDGRDALPRSKKALMQWLSGVCD